MRGPSRELASHSAQIIAFVFTEFTLAHQFGQSWILLKPSVIASSRVEMVVLTRTPWAHFRDIYKVPFKLFTDTAFILKRRCCEETLLH